MANLYLTEQGAVLHKSGDRLIVTKQEATLLEVPCHQIDAVLIFGNVHFTTPAVRELVEHGIEMALFTRRGKLLCQLTPPMAKNVLLRFRQYELSKDKDFSLSFARSIVAAKIGNGLALVAQHAYNHKEAGLDAEMDELRRQIEHAGNAANHDELLGIEGSAARTYFEAFGRMVRAELGFEGRRKHPPADPVNAMLSLGYTLLSNEAGWILDGIGFDPYIGFLHQPHYGRASLATDMVEEFRAPVVDRLTLRLVNNRVLTESDFYSTGGSGSVFMRRESLGKYFREYEGFIGEGLAVSDDKPPSSLREQLRHQAYALERALTAAETYQPFALKV